jgi:ribosomal protein S18 acetylase RimI-like enzyme
MPGHPLDNPIWNALTTAHTSLAVGTGPVRRYDPLLTPLMGMERTTPDAFEELASLLEVQRVGAGFFYKEPALPPGWSVVHESPLVQMVWDGRAPGPAEPDIVELCAADNPQMLDLATRTQPGPFNTRTHELGTYLGIREQGKLLAMAGERLKLDDYVEISAVCTDPDARGRGYASRLLAEVARRIIDGGRTPMLHVRGDNVRAIRVYEAMGFVTRHVLALQVLKRPD